MGYLACIIIGMIIGGGFVFYTYVMRNRPSGTFVIDLSDPIKDVCRFELDESLESIYAKKRMILNVKTYSDISSK
jgi:hypothetical protein